MATGSEPWIPARKSLPVLRQAVQLCRGCDLYLNATQAVFGAGKAKANVFLIGEQPGNDEDLKGQPFIGPAGKLLDRALVDAGIDRAEVYVTNAVKHFKFEERGKRRIHAKPGAREISACRPWLEAEIQVVTPRILVCLGATASQTVLGKDFRLTQHRGVPMEHAWASRVLATIHPSAILRIGDADQRHAEYERFVGDLRLVPAWLAAKAST
jgi:DNA polymerase